MKLHSSDRVADKALRKKRDETLERLKNARKMHETWVRQQYPNSADIVAQARDIVEDFELSQGLKRGSIEATFDTSGVHLGYFLVVKGRCPHEQDLVAKIRETTGETFEVDHVLAT
ncbi:MAG: hypothetical protein ACE5EL_08555 [Anaerolineae bacterium]